MQRSKILSIFVIVVSINSASAQMITNKSVFGQIFSAEYAVDAPIDKVMKRLSSTDSLAKIMNFVNRENMSKGFEKVGDAAIFIPFYSNQKNHDYGIVMLTYCIAGSEMRFTYEPMDGSYFFQDIYKASRFSENKTSIIFSRRYTAPDFQSPQQISEQTQWVEGSMARFKVMMEAK